MSVRVSYEVNDQIIKDIKRTYSGMKYFDPQKSNEGFKKLHRLLIAISSYKDVGYLQGINFIAASFLWHCNEEYAYFLIIRLFEKLRLVKLYSENLQHVEEKCDDFFENVLEQSSPKIYNNLKEKNIKSTMILAEWIITLGFSTIPLVNHIQIFSGLFDGGWNYLFGLLLRFLRTLYPYFEHADFSDTMQLIKSVGHANPPPEYKVDLNWDSLTRN